MGDKISIEWTDATWNPIVGCSLISPGCTNCYAMKMAARIERMGTAPHYAGTTTPSKAGAVWNGQMALAPEHVLLAPLRRRNPTTWFVNSMGDLFHEAVPDEWIDRVFAVMALSSQHTFQVLTKRSQRMREYVKGQAPARVMGWIAYEDGRQHTTREDLPRWPLPNVWLGISAEDQARADERIPDLLATPAAIRFVSAEPLLGPIDFGRIPSPVVMPEDEGYYHEALVAGDIHYRDGDPDILTGRIIVDAVDGPWMPDLNWIIAGGESGPGARPMHPNWARSLRDQCAAADVPFFFKQWGEWSPCSIEEHEDGTLGPAYPMAGCCDPDVHNADQEALFWQGDRLVHWPGVETASAIGARRVGKARAGRLLDGRIHDAMPAVRS